jgi:hypothetical protein
LSISSKLSRNGVFESIIWNYTYLISVSITIELIEVEEPILKWIIT